MSIVHHRAVLITSSGDRAMYRFYPEHLGHPSVVGEFEVDVIAGDVRVTLPSERDGIQLNWTDDHCVMRLASKIRRQFREDGHFPDEIFFVA